MLNGARTRNDDLVALIDECLSERECHKVDGSCGSGSENYLFASGGVNIFLDSIACAFIFICGIDGEFMDRAMDVGVRATVAESICRSPIAISEAVAALPK